MKKMCLQSLSAISPRAFVVELEVVRVLVDLVNHHLLCSASNEAIFANAPSHD